MASVGGGGPCPARANGSAYRRREPESTLPHATVRAHLKTFLAQVEQRSDGTGLPRFVVSEFERYLAEGELRADREDDRDRARNSAHRHAVRQAHHARAARAVACHRYRGRHRPRAWLLP